MEHTSHLPPVIKRSRSSRSRASSLVPSSPRRQIWSARWEREEPAGSWEESAEKPEVIYSGAVGFSERSPGGQGAAGRRLPAEMDEVFVWNPAATAAVSTIEATDGWKRFSLFSLLHLCNAMCKKCQCSDN